MTILNRALDKAYRRQRAAVPADAVAGLPTEPQGLTEGLPKASGWASQLRDPVRPLASAAPRASAPSATIAGTVEKALMPARARGRGVSSPTALPVSAPAPAVELTGAKVRLDAPHRPSKVDGPSTIAPPAKAQATVKSEPPAASVIDGWTWPPIVEKLLASRARAEIAKLAANLKNLAIERGLGCIALTGPGRGAGRTTLVLTLARLLSDLPATRVTVIDADFGHPDASGFLAAPAVAGLWEAACGDGKSTAAVRRIVPGRLALVPLTNPVATAAIDRDKIRSLHSFLRALRRENEIVLIDAGPWESLIPPLIFESHAVDACICVCRADIPPDEKLDEEALRQPGVEFLGTIETFTQT